MTLRVRLGSGSGVEWLMATMAVADPDWRAVLDHGVTAYDVARATGGRDLVRDATRIGRLGWVNLLGPLTRRRAGWTLEALRADAAAMPPDELHRVLTGQHRRSPTEVSPWLRRTPAVEVRRACLRVLDALPAPTAAAPSVAPLRRRLTRVGDQAVIDEVAPGIHYGPGVLGRVVLVPSEQVRPIVVELAEPDRTVVVHPSIDESGATDAAVQLRELGRAVGDATRMRILQQLRASAATLPELCAALESPRTTLLHHLAMLRAAGLIDLTVTEGEANVYRLRPDGFGALARAAQSFPLR